MYETTYHKPTSLDEAIAMMTSAEEGRFISGGQTLIPTMKQRLAAPSDLIDLRHIADMKGITVEGTQINIGAATPHAEVAASFELRACCPGLCDLAGMIGDPHVRHMGTIGGSIANNDPAADYPAAMLALNAVITTSKQTISADDFFTGLFETALDEDEIVVNISFTAPEKSGYSKFPNPASRYAMAGVFVAKNGPQVRVAVTGAGADGVFRHQDMETALTNDWHSGALDACEVNQDNLLSDIHGDAVYRANLIKVMAKRAVVAAG